MDVCMCSTVCIYIDGAVEHAFLLNFLSICRG